MSRRRNRHHSLSNASRISQRQQPHSKSKLNKMMKSTAQSFYMTPRSQTLFNQDIQKNERLYNRNISFFRDNFNQNDTSQLPFMSTLRESQKLKQREPKSTTICYPFQAALKNTANQVIKKRISDFVSKQRRLSGVYYRWHNKTGMNNKWGAEFQCTLRDYDQQKNEIQKKFNSFIQPIVYNDIQEKIYEKGDLICSKGRKSFKIR